MSNADAPAAPLDRAVETLRDDLKYVNASWVEVAAGSDAADVIRSAEALLAALDADRGEAEKTLKWIEVHEAFHYSDDRTWALALKDAARRYFARREGEKGENRG